MKKLYCAYCGFKLEPEIPTVLGSKLVCKSSLCKLIEKNVNIDPEYVNIVNDNYEELIKK